MAVAVELDIHSASRNAFQLRGIHQMQEARSEKLVKVDADGFG